MTTQEIITAISVLMLSGIAFGLYLMKNAPLIPDEPHLYDLEAKGQKRMIFNIVLPGILVIIFILIAGMLYNSVYG